MKNRILTALAIVALLQVCVYAGSGNTLAVPLIGQEKSNWCWDASSNMILQFYGFTHTQTEVANWAVGGYNVGNHLSSTTVGLLAAPGKPSPGNYNRKGCGQVLTNFGPVDSTFLDRSLTMNEAREEIDSHRPAILTVRWISKGKDAGGHTIVLYGYSSDLIELHDPWPASNDPCEGCSGVAYEVDYDAMFDTNGPTYSHSSAVIGNRWAQTLKTGRALDLCFLIDTTASMESDINSVKSASLTLIDDLVANYKDLRIAVVDYRDYPVSPYGVPGTDYITNVDTVFTTDANTAKAVINSLVLGNGGDIPDEAVFSALIRTMSGSEIGAWRKDVERRIILMGDAPGHNPEPWDGGYSYSDVLAYWLTDPNKVSIFPLLTWEDHSSWFNQDANSQFSGLAAATGGSTRYAEASGAGAAMADIIDEFTLTPRHPQGDVAAFKPVFTFIPPTESMGPLVKNILLEIQNWNVNKSVWKNYKKFTLPADATSYTLLTPLPMGDYRWRLGYVRGSGTFLLPDATSSKMTGVTLMEPNWTEFTRVIVMPTTPELLDPSVDFTADTKDIHYTFTSAVNASSYAMEIWHYDIKKTCWKRWKNLTVKPPAKDPSAAILDVKVTGHICDPNNADYEWRVEPLNYDRTKVDPNYWVGLPLP